jgi:hypothetical protein
MDDPKYGWARYLSGEISVVTVPGQHTDLFAPPSQRHREFPMPP